MANYLIHHGVAGQKWGERNAEWYPIAEYESAKKRGTLGDSIKEYRQKKQKQKAGRELAKKRKKVENAIRTGDEKYLKRHPEKFSSKDIAKFTERQRLMNTLNSELNKNVNAKPASKEEKESKEAKAKRGMEYVEAMSKTLGTFATLTKNGIDLYNNVAKISNTVRKDGKLPIIGSNDKNNDENKDKDKDKKDDKESH